MTASITRRKTVVLPRLQPAVARNKSNATLVANHSLEGQVFYASEDSLTFTHRREEFMDALQLFWFLAIVLMQLIRLLVVVARALQDKPDERCMKIQSC